MKTDAHSYAARQATLLRAIAGLVALSVSCGRSSSSADKPDQPKEVADAAKLVDLGQCDAATDKLRAFVSTHPDDKEAYLVLGDAWTCRGFAKVKAAGRADAEALQEADRAYVSMLKLSPEDVRPLVSSGAVEVFLGDVASAGGHLEAARKADGKNAAALNLSALAIGSDPAKKRQETQGREGAADGETPAWLRALSDGYALRKAPDPVAAQIPRVCTANGCARGAFVETVTIGGQSYPAGTVTDFLKETEGKLMFLDRVHPSKKPGRGWVLHAGPNHAPLPAPVGSRTIVTRLPPARPFPNDHVAATTQETQAITDWERSWGWYSRSERDIPGYLSALGPVNGDIVPGSVKVLGELQYLGGPPKPGFVPGGSVFAPVSYEEFVYDERAVDPKAVARVTLPERDAAIIIHPCSVPVGGRKARAACRHPCSRDAARDRSPRPRMGPPASHARAQERRGHDRPPGAGRYGHIRERRVETDDASLQEPGRSGSQMKAGRQGRRDVRYRLGRRLGVGGMAEVFAATATGAGLFERAVALKRVLPAFAQDPSFAANFMEEARLAGLLSHPSIVAVLDFDQDEKGELFLVMEYVDGVSLAELARTGPVPFPVVAYVAAEALSGLGHAHALPGSGRVRGMVHRDVTPGNLLLSGDGAVKLADFGIAKALTGTTASVSVPIKGTVGYASPEKLEGRDLDGRSDLFSLGVVLWQLLAWESLFHGCSPAEVMTQILFRDLPRPSARRGGIPADLEAVAMKLLARERANRYQTAGMAVSDLSACEAMPRDGRRCLAAVIAERFTRAPGAHGRWLSRPGFRPETPAPPEAMPRRNVTVTAPPEEVPVREQGLIAAPGVPDAPPIAVLHEVPQEAPPQEAPPFTFDEYMNLIDAMERSPRPGRSRNVALVHLLFHLGLAPEVLSGLELEQLDLDARAFLEVKVADRGEPRTVPFNDLVTEALERYVEDRRAQLRGADVPWLFITKRGKNLCAREMRDLVRGVHVRQLVRQ